MSAIRDTATIFIRESLPVWHDPGSMAFSLVQPLVFLGMFGPLLSGMPGMQGLPGASVWQWFVPGILVMLCLFGPVNAGYMLLTEMRTGSHERLLVTPVNRSAMLVGRALKEIAPLVAQAAIIVAATVPFGFRLYPAGALIGLLLLVVFGVSLAALSYALAIAVRKQDWMFWAVQQTFLFPVLILSGMLLPLDMGPGWMQVLGRINPLTYLVEAQRALFSGNIAQPVVLRGALVTVALVVVGIALGTRAMRRSTS